MADDLLAFVQSLDAADEEAVGGVFPDGTLIKRRAKAKKPLKPLLTGSNKLSLDDLVEDSNDFKLHRKKKRSEPLSVPLVPVLKRKVEQQIAYEETKKDMSKWTGAIRENRTKECQVFPQNVSMPPACSVNDLSTFIPQNDFERKYLDLVGRMPQEENDHSLDKAFPVNRDAIVKDVEAAELRAKKRSDSFFRDRKAAHQSRIKSKKYRKMVARERQRDELKAQAAIPMTERLLKAHDPQEKAKRTEQRMMERAKERLTLKTRRANQWASEMLLHRHSGHSGDPVSRQEILEQVRAKDALRREVMGKSDEEDSAEEFASDSEGGEDDIDSLLGDNMDEMREITGDISENEEQAIGRRSFNPEKTDKKDAERAEFINEDLDEVNLAEETEKKHEPLIPIRPKHKLMSERIEKKLAKSAADRLLFQQQIQSELQIPDDFLQAKQQEADQEAPKIKDLTLAGWGSWTGPSYPQTATKKMRVTKSIPGIEQSKRKDACLPHVIITEKRMNTAELEVLTVPFPFATKEEYERSLDVGGMGPEWNTARAFIRKTAPRVKISPGTIIAPLKIKSNSTHL